MFELERLYFLFLRVFLSFLLLFPRFAESKRQKEVTNVITLLQIEAAGSQLREVLDDNLDLLRKYAVFSYTYPVLLVTFCLLGNNERRTFVSHSLPLHFGRLKVASGTESEDGAGQLSVPMPDLESLKGVAGALKGQSKS